MLIEIFQKGIKTHIIQIEDHEDPDPEYIIKAINSKHYDFEVIEIN